MSPKRQASLFFLVAFFGAASAAYAASVSPSAQDCVIGATRAAVANRHNQAALRSLYDRYLGDPFARQAAKPGNWDKFSAKEKALQRAWAKQRTVAAVPQFLQYASADITVRSQKGRIVYGKAALPKRRSSTNLIWYLTGGKCGFYDLNAGGFSLSQLVGNYQQARSKD